MDLEICSQMHPNAEFQMHPNAIEECEDFKFYFKSCMQFQLFPELIWMHLDPKFD
jgi:hypothetical protein